jgi:hypothetical protein
MAPSKQRKTPQVIVFDDPDEKYRNQNERQVVLFYQSV